MIHLKTVVIIATNEDLYKLKSLSIWIQNHRDRCEELGIHFYIKDLKYHKLHAKLFSEISISTYYGCDDNGIYDAWNQALGLIPGDVNNVIFLGVTDRLRLDSFEKLLLTHDDDTLYVASFHEIGLDGSSELKKASLKFLRRLPLRPGFCFSSALIPYELLKRFPFNPQFKILGDFDWMLKIARTGVCIEVFEESLIDFEIGGISNSQKNLRRRMQEYEKILRGHPNWILHYGLMTFYSWLKVILVK